MIPTSFSGSSPPTAVVGGSSGGSFLGLTNSSPFPMGTVGSASGGGGSTATNSNNSVCNSALLGIASLILEGRALAEDEYAVKYSELISHIAGSNTLTDGGAVATGVAGRQSPKPSTSRAGASIYQEHHGGGGSSSATSISTEIGNYLRRKASNSPDSTQSTSLRLLDYYSNSSSESAGSSVESNHSRWSQKLSQLRQESPCAQRQQMAAATTEQKVAVDCVRSVEPEYVALAINTEQSHDERRSSGAGDFEIIRRIALNRMNLYNSPPNSSGVSSGGGSMGVSGGGSVDNFMCSLQSLASNTCLRSGTPIPYNPPITASTPKYAHYRVTPQNQPRFPTPQHTDISGSSANSSGSSNWYSTTGTPATATSHNKDYLLRKLTAMPTPQSTPTNSSSSTNSIYDNSPASHHHAFGRRESSSGAGTTTSATATATPTSSRNSATTTTTTPQQGPHCDQFLRKMGLAKGDASDAEEHHCDMSYVNITCTRWRAYCIKMENILARGEPICIEVYLGPVGHKILLEQWIISVNDKQPPPTMTLPSLCSAIRSQLYFSQISAWCDLIKKADKTIYDTGRLIYTTPSRTSAAGDLATSTMSVNILGTSPTTSLANISNTGGGGGSGGSTSTAAATISNANSTNRWPTSSSSAATTAAPAAAPRLNIFYRIKAYEENSNSMACFNTKPNVHNFPNVNVSENCSVSVCLKSLPRITGGIPKINPAVKATITTTAAATTTPQYTASEASSNSSSSSSCGTWSTMTPTTKYATTSKNSGGLATTNSTAGSAAATTTKSLTINCDNNKNSKEHHHHQKQQQQQQQTAVFNATFLNKGNPKIDDNSSSSSLHPSSSSTDHHDFQKFGKQQTTITNNDSLNSFDGDSFNGSASIGGDSCDLGVGFGEGDSSNSSLSTNYGNLSHREKQLLKYRKRMLKRDKKSHQQQQQQRKTNECNNGTSAIEINPNCCGAISQKMEQGEDDDDDDDVDNNDDDDRLEHQQLLNSASSKLVKDHDEHLQTTTATKGQREQQQQLPNSFKNSIPCGNGQQRQQQQQQHVKMISTGTQTTTTNSHAAAASPTTSLIGSITCSACGYEKSMICLKCNPLRSTTNDEDDGMVDLASSTLSTRSTASSTSSSASSLNSSDIIQTPRNKAELLLQAIQRTPKANKKLKVTKELGQHHNNKQQQQEQEPKASSSSISKNNGSQQPQQQQNRSSCQVCKRQKTQHHFQQPSSSTLQEMNSLENNQTLIADSSRSCPNSSPSPSSISSSTTTSPGNMLVANSQINGDNQSDDILASDSDNEKDGGKMSTTSEDCVDNAVNNGQSKEEKICDNQQMIDNYKERYSQYVEEEYFVSSTKLTPNIERCSLSSNKSYYTQLHEKPDRQINANGTDTQRLCYTPPMMLEYNPKNAKGTGGVMAQFKTPTSSEQQLKLDINRQVQQQPHKQTPKPSLLQIAFNFNVGSSGGGCSAAERSNNNDNVDMNNTNSLPSIHNPLLARRNSPKVNLTRIFCNPNEMKASSPIPISNGGILTTNAAISPTPSGSTMSSGSKSADINCSDTTAPTFSFESPTGPPPPPPSITVQKSNSAPTLPNSPSLSPRFIKASALYKRRSRHLSDRSDRSSLGSDEQFSDEDLDCGMYSPFATSPVKLRSRLSAVFGRKPILGNLEESLLQRRLVPKIEVMGFKLLLGASGGFCPTQLTIPAAAYFYELKGETLSTPYLCEIRLPRKGYSVPRCGTVQATLLNPMGTVVRMFVIPYDMRDMPALHQTFIRQRILADTGSSNNTLTTTTTTMGSSDIMVQNGNIEKDPADGGDNNVTINSNKQQQHSNNIGLNNNNNINNTNGNNNRNMENEMGHFMSAENMKSLRYSIHLRFQTSRSGRLMLHTDIRLLISRRTDCDTAAAHAKGVLEAPNELITKTVMPTNPKYSARHDQTASNKI
ncbi:atos homolog atossa [Musca autumnalis]|uniref:atos homolog atossa n=1 Tax=Musca autumnalis TaxID=221902 RepID=UPI003CE7C22F